MLNNNGSQIWLALGLFCVVAMNVSVNPATHTLRLARMEAQQGHIELASSEHQVRIGDDCNLKLRGKFNDNIITTKGITRDFELECQGGECQIPHSIKVISDVSDLESLASRLEETVDKAGYTCTNGRITKKSRDSSRSTVKSEEKKKEDKKVDFYALLEAEAEKCDDGDLAESLDCISDVIESAVELNDKFQKRDERASKALSRFFKKRFSADFIEAYTESGDDFDKIDLWDSLSRVMALKTRNGKLVAKDARVLKNKVLGKEAAKIHQLRTNLNQFCSGLVGTSVDVNTINQFKCNTLRRELPVATQQLNFELSSAAVPSIASAYLDSESAKNMAHANKMAYDETFGELFRQFSQYSQNATQNLLSYTGQNSRTRVSGASTGISTINTLNSKIGIPNDDIITRLMGTPSTTPAPGAAITTPRSTRGVVTHGPKVSVNSRTVRGN